MKLFINTIKENSTEIELALHDDNDKIIARRIVAARYQQAEKLLPLIDQLLKQNDYKLKDLASIKVVNSGGSFTALRIGVITANALGYALNIPVKEAAASKKNIKNKNKFNIIKPIYTKEPNITVKKE